jgi:hypothetical protein
MEYPGSIFTRPWRRLVLIFFIGLFTLISPLLVLYTIGYRYDTSYGILKKTGALSINIIPRTATVYLNGQNTNKKIPVQLTAIKPDIYHVKITEPGYYDWEKDVEIKDKQTSYIKDVRLIKKADPFLLASGSINNISLSPNGTFLLYQNHLTTTNQAVLFHLESGKSHVIADEISLKITATEWSFDQKYAFIQTSKNSLYIIDLERPDQSFELASPQKNSIIKAHWRKTIVPELYFESSNHVLYSFNPTLKTSTLVKNLHEIGDWTVYNDEVWELSINSSTRAWEITKNSIITPQKAHIITDPRLLSTPLSEWRIAGVVNETVVLARQGTAEMILVEKDKYLPVSADHIVASPNHNSWLFFNNHELWKYEEESGISLITRSSDGLKTVLLLDSFSALLLIGQKNNTVLFPYYFASHDFLKESFQEIKADDRKRVLYFTTTKGLWKMEY